MIKEKRTTNLPSNSARSFVTNVATGQTDATNKAMFEIRRLG